MQTSIDIFRNNRDPMPNVRFSTPEEKCGAKWYSMRIEDREYGNVTLNVHTDSLDELLDFGYSIVNQVNALKVNAAHAANNPPIDFGESLEANVPADAEPAFVPFAINDAVDQANVDINSAEYRDIAERL